MILCFLQYSSKSPETWLSWPSSTNNRCTPVFRSLVYFSKSWINSKPISLLVHPLGLVRILQSSGMVSSSYYEDRWYRPATTMYGGIAQPVELTAWITVAYSGSHYCIVFGRVRCSELVTTIPMEILPIIKPVSSKL
jgi:hypothetical protein